MVCIYTWFFFAECIYTRFILISRKKNDHIWYHMVHNSRLAKETGQRHQLVSPRDRHNPYAVPLTNNGETIWHWKPHSSTNKVFDLIRSIIWPPELWLHYTPRGGLLQLSLWTPNGHPSTLNPCGLLRVCMHVKKKINK